MTQATKKQTPEPMGLDDAIEVLGRARGVLCEGEAVVRGEIVQHVERIADRLAEATSWLEGVRETLASGRHRSAGELCRQAAALDLAALDAIEKDLGALGERVRVALGSIETARAEAEEVAGRGVRSWRP
jgi:Arc/MetJ-type ribon-helix-helix transcriptional regulator